MTHDLSITRTIHAPRDLVWRCWTEPALLMEWHCPKPWRLSAAELDVRPGGRSFMVMSGPNGEENRLPGQYLEVKPLEKLVFTDAFDGDWRPVGTPFMVGYVELSEAENRATRMVWGARHWRAEDRQSHLDMGFEQGWNAAADQLDALAQRLAKEKSS